MIPLAIPNLVGNEGRYLQACIDENFVSTVGRFVGEFQDALAQVTGFSHATVTSQGTTALHLGLTALGVDTNDLVIIPDLTFVATANAVAHCKAVPWIIDVCADTWTLDTELLKKSLAENCEINAKGETVHIETGRRVAAIMPVYSMGLAPDLDTICDIAEEWNIPVIADAAAALGTNYKGGSLGNTRPNLTMMSFNGNKIITSGGGGVLLSNDEQLMKRVNHLCTTARQGADYDHDMVGFNYRMTNIQAAVGLGQIENVDIFVDAKRNIAQRYADGFSQRKDIEAFKTAPWSIGNHWFSGIFLPKWDAQEVVELRSYLRTEGIDARSFWKPMHTQRPFASAPCNLNGVASSSWEKILPLPCSTQLTIKEQEHVIASVKSFARTDNSI